MRVTKLREDWAEGKKTRTAISQTRTKWRSCVANPSLESVERVLAVKTVCHRRNERPHEWVKADR